MINTWLCPYCNAENDNSFTNCEGCDKAQNQQKQAINQYLIDKSYYLVIESNTAKHAVFSGFIDTRTGRIDDQCSVHWQYFGKQAVRTAYFMCRKTYQTVYTW